MITAEQAKQNMEAHVINLDEFLKNVENMSKNGHTNIKLFDVYTPLEFLTGLLKLGFKISNEKGSMGESIIVISWI